MSFTVKKLEIPGLLLVKPKIQKDLRGFFAEIYKFSEYKKMGVPKLFLQVNYSRSSENVLRGLHYQAVPMAQAKLVRVMYGEIFDVAVDIRRGSPSYGQWVGVKLSAKSKEMFYVPEGFAHGFCVLSLLADVEYLSSQIFSPRHERGIRWNDPCLNIRWPIKKPVLSAKDKHLPCLEEAENNFVYARK